jgi:hypothetical protein
MMDRVLACAGDWAVRADGLQWILERRAGKGWRSVSFVRSTRDVLVRCMREKGTEPHTADLLLSRLPDTFDEWKAAQDGPSAGIASCALAALTQARESLGHKG